MSGSVRELLFTDFTGAPVSDPDTVITAGVDDPAHRDRVPGLVRALHEAEIDPAYRFLAAFALVSWAEPAGFAAVGDAVRTGRDTDWYGTSIDRMYSVDDTFAQLASAVATAADLAAEKGTEPQRIEALRALIGIADTEYFDTALRLSLDAEVVAVVQDDIRQVVDRGVRRLADGDRPGFDLGGQLAVLATSTARVSDAVSVQLGTAVLSVDSSPQTCRVLTGVVRRGRGPLSEQFGEHLAAVGGPEVAEQVAEAARHRPRGTSVLG